MKNITSQIKLNRTGARVSSPSSGVRPGARALNLELPTSFGISLFVGVLGLLVGGLFSSAFLSHSTYAASYLNVSSGSGGTISFGSIKPTSTGTSATTSDTLTIHTDCSVGYSVYVSGQNGKDTSLTNSSAESNNTISTSSNAIGSAGSLSSNTWGLNSENTGKYVGLPSYSDALNAALTVKSNVEEASTVPIYYGIKVDTSLTPGTYTGDVLYTVLMDSSCLAYTVIFNANGGSGTMDNQSIMASTATKLTANTFTRSGYTFLGWSTRANGKTETAVNGVGTEADVDYANQAEVTDLTTGSSSITLYAIWEQDVATMQGWTGCPALTTGQSTTLKDIRDDKRYVIKKLPDGKCWMMQNLTIGSNGAQTLTSENTNIDNGKTYYLPPAGKQGTGTIDDPSTLTATDAANFDSSDDQHSKTQFRAKSSDIINDSDTGYYNFYTATLGYSYHNSGPSGSSTRDICPKNWRLPKTTDAGATVTTVDRTNDFTYLAQRYDAGSWGNSATSNIYYTNSSTAMGSMFKAAASPLATTTQNEYAGYSYVGIWKNSNSDIGAYGSYWSSSVYNTEASYALYFGSLYLYTQNSGGKSNGTAVRCVAQDNYTIAYSSDGAGNGEASKTSETVFQNNGTINVTMPTAGTMVRSGHEFKGWALTSGATTATYQAEETVALSTLLIAASAAGQATPGSTITLYPVWEALPTAMQNFICSNLTAGTSTTLRDARDNQQYTVYRFPTDVKYAGTSTVANVAGKCIMTKDLNLGAVASVSGASSTIVANGTMTLSPDDSGFTTPTGSGEDISVPTSNVTVSMTWSTTDSYSNKSYHANGTDNYAGRGYYSWGAAMVVCPKNWRLPTGDEYNNSGSWESSTTGISAVIKGNNAAESIANITSDPYSFTLGGHYNNGFGLATSNGAYWSSTQADSSNAYELGTILSYGLSRGSLNKRYGYAVRCISDPPVEDCSETVHPTTTTGCKMKDDNEWILGNNGGTVTWNNLCTSSDNCNSTTYCPSGYSIPAKAIYDTLISKQGSGSELYSALGITGERYFWSSTEQDAAVALGLRVHWSSASVVGALIGVDRLYKTYSVYVLCYKPS